jgi:hypothetical protein
LPPFPVNHRGILVSTGGDPDDLTARCMQHKFGWLALQRVPANDARAERFRNLCQARGIQFGIWADRGHLNPDFIVDYNASFYIGEAEAYATSWGPIVERASELLDPERCAVVTNFGSFTKPDGTPSIEKARPLVEAGWACLTEAYLPEQPQLAPNPCARLEFRARQLGFWRVQPCIEVINGFPASAYAELQTGHRGYSVWLGETMQDADWEWLGGTP